MKKQAYFLLFGVLMLTVRLSAQPSKDYCNQRFGFCVDYPASLKVMPEGAVNADGIILESPEGLKVSISGSFNVMDWTPQRIHEFAVEDLSADLGAKVAPIESSIDENGFETRFSDGSTYQYARMWNLGDTYLVITVTGPRDQSEKIEALKDMITPTFGS